MDYCFVYIWPSGCLKILTKIDRHLCLFTLLIHRGGTGSRHSLIQSSIDITKTTSWPLVGPPCPWVLISSPTSLWSEHDNFKSDTWEFSAGTSHRSPRSHSLMLTWTGSLTHFVEASGRLIFVFKCKTYNYGLVEIASCPPISTLSFFLTNGALIFTRHDKYISEFIVPRWVQMINSSQWKVESSGKCS